MTRSPAFTEPPVSRIPVTNPIERRIRRSSAAPAALRTLVVGAALTATIAAQSLIGAASPDAAGQSPGLAAPVKVVAGDLLRYDFDGKPGQGALLLLAPSTLAAPDGIAVPGVGIETLFDLVRSQAALFQTPVVLDGSGRGQIALTVPTNVTLDGALAAQAVGFDPALGATGAFSSSAGVRTTFGNVAPAGAYVSDANLARARARGASSTDPLRTVHGAAISRANGYLSATADPFTMPNMTAPVASGGITMSWYGSGDGVDNSLRDAVDDFEKGGDQIYSLALGYGLTRDPRYADKAIALMRTWAAQHTPVNMYDFRIDFVNGTFDGLVPGWTDGRPWNFALDTIWQCYGLSLIADAYTLLKRNGYELSADDDDAYRAWILKCAEAVNSGFHAWTRWADAHPTSGSYERYRSDNHLSWALSGLMAAGVALDDHALVDYVLNGGAWHDSRAGLYANPSHIRDVIDRAIEGDGRVYEEKIRRSPPIGYSFFHLIAMSLVARQADVHTDDDIWNHRGADGGGLERAFDRYAGFILGTRTSPDPVGDSNLGGPYSWTFEMPYAKWRKPDARQVLLSANRSYWFRQSIGPVALLVGETL